MPDSVQITSSTVDRDNPWPGLSSFTEDARGFFFGREEETDQLSRLVRRQTLTVLFGQSGLGKSSLLQAGLFPILRESDHLPLYLRLDHAASAPDLVSQVKSALNAAFAEAKADAPAFRDDETLWEYFHRKDVDIWSAKNRLLTPVLAFDQFEEVFTLGRTDETCRERSRAFLSELACLVENRPPPAVKARLDAGQLDPARFNFEKPSCQVILSLREDFLPDLEGLRQEMPALIHNRLRLKKLSGTRALEIVSRPAPHLLADGVAERIVEFVAGGRGGSAERLAELDVEPPLLSVICRELNDRRRALGHAQISADLVSGNRREILTDFYERSVADLPDDMRKFVEDHLLTKSGFRDNLAMETALEFSGVTRELIDTLVARRLLRVEDRLGVQRVELTHDVLADVIRASRDARQQRMAAADAARHTRRLRWLVAALVVVVIGLSIGAVFGLRAQRRAAVQASRTDLVLATREFDAGRAAEGIAYAVRAARANSRTPAAAPRLLSALVSRSFLLPDGAPFRVPAGIEWIDYSPDGRELYVICPDSVVRMLDTSDGSLKRELKFESKIARWGWSGFPEKDPTRFAVHLEDDTIHVCDAATGQTIGPVIHAPKRFNPYVFLEADGRTVGIGSQQGIWTWDVATGKSLEPFEVRSVAMADAATSPDGTLHVACFYSGYIYAQPQPDKPPLWPDGLKVANQSYAISFSPDGHLLAVATDNGVLLLDSHTSEKVVPLLQTGDAVFFKPRFTPDGQRVVDVSRDRYLRVWNVATGELAFPPLPAGPMNLARDFDLSRDGTVALSLDRDGYTRLYDLVHGRLLTEPALKQDGDCISRLAPDGHHAVVGTVAGLIYPVHPDSGAARPLEVPLTTPRPHRGSEWVMLPDLPERLSRITDHGAVVDIASGRETDHGFTLPPGFTMTSVSNNHRFIIAHNAAGEEYAGHFESGELKLLPLVEAGNQWKYHRYSADGSLLVTVTNDSEDRAFRVWDLRTGQPASPLIKTERIYYTALGSFSPDDKRTAIGTYTGGAQVWDLATGKVVFDLLPSGGANQMNFVQFSPDGKRIATASFGEARLWDAQTGQPVSPVLPLNGYVLTCAFSRDGRFFAAGSDSGVVQVWDARDGTAIGEPMLHGAPVNSLDFDESSSRLVTGSTDRTARVWDVQTGLALTEPYVHPASVGIVAAGTIGVRFSPGPGRFIMTTTNEGIYLWPVPPASNGPVPAWLMQLATASGGKVMSDTGVAENLPGAGEKIDALRRTVAALPEDAPYAAWARWYFADRATRSIAPGFTITAQEAEKLAAP